MCAAPSANFTGPRQCDSRSVLSQIKLAVDDGEGVEVTVLQRLGLPDEAVFAVAWDELDRAFAPDHLTSLYVPALAAPVAGELARFDELVRTLRRDCPWDAEQTHESLRRHLVEEAYEVLDALDATIAATLPARYVSDPSFDFGASEDGIDLFALLGRDDPAARAVLVQAVTPRMADFGAFTRAFLRSLLAPRR